MINFIVYYWFLNCFNGLIDLKINFIGVKCGKIENVFYRGFGNGFLYMNGRVWVDFGDFIGFCIVEFLRCREVLIVFLWLKYYLNRNKRYFVGILSYLIYLEGFIIYKELDDIVNNIIIFKVNDG